MLVDAPSPRGSDATLAGMGTLSGGFERFVAAPLQPRSTCDGTHGLIVFCFSSFRQSFQQLSGRKRAALTTDSQTKESLSHLWDFFYEGAMLRYLQKWIDQLRWQRLKPMEKLAQMLLDHLDGILNYCRTKVPMGVVEAVNGNIKALLRRGRGYRDMNHLLLKAQRLAATKTEFVAFRKAA